MDLRSRLIGHAEKVKRAEELEAAMAGAFDQKVQFQRERFETLVREVLKPAFDDFKKTLREIGKDASIIMRMSHDPKQAITLILLERYLSFGAGKTIKLVNPNEEPTARKTTKFYEVYRVEDKLFVHQRWDAEIEPVVTEVPYEAVGTLFLENELAAFFERAHPMVCRV